MPFIEDFIEEQKLIWGEYLPCRSAKALKERDRSCVMVKDVGCVFIGTVEQCQAYIRDNEHRYEKKDSRRLLTV
jgi:hypothetical protein